MNNKPSFLTILGQSGKKENQNSAGTLYYL